MKHTMVTFRLHRSGVILIAVFTILFAVLIYAAGYLTAVRMRKPPAVKAQKPAIPKVIAPPVKAAPPPEAVESLALRVAVLTAEEDAKALVVDLTARGLKPTIVPAQTSSAVTLYTVVVGHYTTRRDALAAADELMRRHRLSSVVVPAP